MKNYFLKHQSKLKTQPSPTSYQTENLKLYKQDISQQFTWIKPIKTNSFFKHKQYHKNIIQNTLNNNHKHHSKYIIQSNSQTNYPIQQVAQFSNQHTIRQNTNTIKQSQNTIRQSKQSINSQNIKQRGFSLQYLKMTKKHKIKSLLELNLNKQIKKQRTKTLFQSPFNNINDKFLNQSNHVKGNNQHRKLLTPLSQQLAKQKQKQSSYQTQYNHHSKTNNNRTMFLNKNKHNKLNTFFQRCTLAQDFLSKNPYNSPNSQQNNNQISFVPIQNIHLKSTKYHHFANNINHSSQRQINKTFVKRSKYSPFKSRNASSTSINQPLQIDKIQVKSFQNQNQITPTFSAKQIKNFKLTRHKKHLSNLNKSYDKKQLTNQNLKDNYQNQLKLNQSHIALSVIENQQTYKIIVQGLYGNIKLLSQLKQYLTVQCSPSKVSNILIDKITQLVKIYVFGQKNKQKQNDKSKQIDKQKETIQKKYPNHLFSQLNHIFQKQSDSLIIKQVICLQRLLIICIVDLLGQQKLYQLFQQFKLTVTTIIIIYLKIFKSIKNINIQVLLNTQQAQQINSMLKSSKFKSNNTIQHHLKTQLSPYVDNLFRHSRDLYQSLLKQQIQDSKNRTINRSFYQILKKYAIYLTNHQQNILRKYNHQLISNFATCPAPYILVKPEKLYTLCIDLDQTLLFSKFSCTKKFETIYRPGAKEFVIQLSKYFEIIVFTSSVQEYANQVIKPFIQFVDHILYRYHVTRGRNLSSTVKDLSRIGRRLEKVIFIDDLQCNLKLQPENSIKVTPWKGNLKDTQLINLKKQLLEFGKQQNEQEDVRKIVSEIKQKIKNHKIQKED